jgi:hypothetical protein
MMIWASVCSIRVKLCRCNVFISPASCPAIFVGRHLSELWEIGLSQVASAENLNSIWGIYPIQFPVCA